MKTNSHIESWFFSVMARVHPDRTCRNNEGFITGHRIFNEEHKMTLFIIQGGKKEMPSLQQHLREDETGTTLRYIHHNTCA